MLPSVTYTLVNGTTIDGSQIDKNFNDIIESLNSGNKDVLVKNITCNSLSLATLRSRNSLSASSISSTSAEATSSTTVSSTTTASKIGTESESITIDTSSAIAPSYSKVELNSTVYQVAAFSDGIDIVLNTNDKINFVENVAELTATIPAGTYTAAALATAVETQLNAVGSNLYTCTFHTTYFRITSDNEVTFKWRTGTNWATTAGKNLGIFTTNDATGSTFDSDYPYQIAYTENLATITATNFSTGSILVLHKTISSNSKVITIKNGTGNINCGSDRVLTDYSSATLIYLGTAWKLLSYSGN